MRIARITLVGALLLGAVACQTDDGGAVNAKIPPLAFVRYINAVPDTFNLTVRFVDQLEFSPMTFVNVPFRGLGQGGYQGTEAGSRHFRVFTYDPRLASGGTAAVTAQMADTTFDFVAGQYYTILHLGYARAGQAPAQRVYILNDAVPTPTAAQVAVRAIHAGLGIGAVDIFATPLPTTALAGAPAFANVGYNATTAYANLPVGQFAAQIAATGTLTSLAAAAAPAGVAGTPAADPIAGATVGGSVLTAIAFPAHVYGSPAATYPSTLGNNRTSAGIAAVAGGYELTDSVAVGAPGAANYTAGFCVPTATRYCRLIVTPPAASGLLPIDVAVTNNTANTVVTAADLSAYLGPFTPRARYSLVAYNAGVVWFSDRQPPRTTP